MKTTELRQSICHIGQRIYQRGFAAATDGNISCRLSANEILCTPTMQCKGILTPDDLCTVDLQGNQLAGKKKPSSEIRLHLEILKARPDVQSVVHCHPPHATAFAVAREPIPQCVLPEFEYFLGNVPIARYETPGTQAFAETVLPFVHQTDTILLANHGSVSYGESAERAFWLTEILDAYCRILILARGLGHIERIPDDKARELLELKKQAGFRDPRNEPGFPDSDLCNNAVFRDRWAEAHVAERAFGQTERTSTDGAEDGGS